MNPSTARRLRTALLLGTAPGLLLALCVVAEHTLELGGAYEAGGWRLLRWYALGWVIGAAAVAVLRVAPMRVALGLILVGGAALQIVAASTVPTTTDDFHRYIWDGKVQAAGISPYRYTPLDPAVAHLRDPALFPARPPAPPVLGADIPPEAAEFTDPCRFNGVPHDCTWINRPTVATIYPPVAEAAFFGLHLLPGQDRVQVVQWSMAVLALLMIPALWWALPRLGHDRRWSALWAFSPVVWLETGNNAHIDVLGVLLLVVAFGLLGTTASPGARRAVAVGALFGAAIAVKLLPALAAPVFLTRRRIGVLFAAGAFFVALYLPHVLTVGAQVLGYLPGYLREEGYSGTTRFGVPRLLFGDTLGPPAAFVALAVICLLVWRSCASPSAMGSTTSTPPALGALVVTGSALVLIGPSQPWYGLLIVALAVLSARPEWVLVAVAAYPVYQSGWTGIENSTMQQLTYLPAAIVVLGVNLLRRRGRAAGRTPRNGSDFSALLTH